MFNIQYIYLFLLLRKPDIPEDSPITFDLELIKVEDRPNYNTLPLGEVIDIG